MQASEPIRRTPEIEELSNLYLIHPIARRLASLFAALHIPPNAVSFAGMLFGILAGIFYYRYQDWRCAVAGFALMIAWHIMDGADGQLARLTQSQSESGKIIDGLCDYVTFIAVYISLAMVLSHTAGAWIWSIIIVSGLCHAVQAAAYEVQRQDYNFWGWNRDTAELSRLDQQREDSPDASAARRLLGILHRLYLHIQWQVAGMTLDSRRELAAIIEHDPARGACIRREYREIFAPAVRQWSILSANYRTLGIFIAALLNSPLAYFWFEIIGFNAIMIALIARQRSLYKSLFRALETPP